jgi:hypothetical protein
MVRRGWWSFGWRRTGLLQAAAAIVLLAGCATHDFDPKPCAVPAPGAPPVRRFDGYHQTAKSNSLGQTQTRDSHPGFVSGKDAFLPLLQKKGVAGIFCTDASALRTSFEVTDTYRPHDDENMLSALLCGFTLGLAPVCLKIDRTLECDVSVKMESGEVVRNYRFTHEGKSEIWALPPGLLGLFAAIPQQKEWMEQEQDGIMTQLLTKFVVAANADQSLLAQAKDKNAQYLALKEKMGGAGGLPVAGTPAAQAVRPEEAKGPAGALPPPAAIRNVHILVVGISRYQDKSIQPLRFANDDAQATLALFRDSDISPAKRENVHFVGPEANADGLTATKQGK